MAASNKLRGESRIDPTAVASLVTIPGITEQSIKTWLRIARPLTAAEDVYREIIGYVDNSQDHGYGIKVLSIFHLARMNDVEFQHRYDPASWNADQRMMLWHGTTDDVVANILKEGFQIPPLKIRSQMFGRAIYFTDRASKAANYCRNSKVGTTAYLFLCDVMLGKSYEAARAHHDWTSPPAGYDSVKCSGRKIPDPNGDVCLMGSLIPKGITIGNTKYPHYPLIYNEYAIYAPEKVKTMYLLKIEFKSSKFTNVSY